ncbi:ABC transporter permease [Pimelobacter simplex]|uniref:ABC transporter permease n=1 Tax=Nocardioides simplex TaxID=2045 RepID=A0A0A1DJ80_NOCSI|nr:ABC transporter permease [Pimelobacter simplex]AIY16618.1 Nucleoside ABC transporter, permease protein 2 [Pimelobacter simplex]KAB2809478.1 ABC transporter permease [Pimelobacter simplex]MCG8154027.1 ABC transporter permease [Pimelobacter simplex]SFN15073.1 nucleoside ABC transporter membrane protein [Pimelobacter simplex]GEB15435.1 ABC transporter permease [Pimelobacter simplex]
MSTTIDVPVPAAVEPSALPLRTLIKTPIMLGVVTLAIALLIALNARSGDTGFRLATDTDFFELPEVTLPSTATVAVIVALLAACTAVSALLVSRARRTPLWLIAIFSVLAMTGFLAWAAAGKTVPVVGLLGGSIALAVPLVFGALGGVLGERAGVVNIAIDGQLLFGAFAAAMFGTIVGSPWGGLVAAMFAGALVALVLGFFAINYFVDQVIVGVVLNVLVIGLTSFLFSQVLADNPQKLNAPDHFSRIPIPVLGDLPVIGPVLFRQTILVYLMYAAVVVVAWALYRTKWGLRVRAVGEHPKAADTVGIKVNRTRYTTLLIAGLIAGAGGATYTLVSVPQFGQEMTDGAGYIALAAVIFGRWDPVRATLAALLFGFASNLSGVLSVLGSPVPSQFMLMLPYVVTIVAVAGLVGASRAPAADGVPYRKG